MANVTVLTDRLIEASGLDGADVRLRARYLREAGLLPTLPRGGRGGRSTAPQIEIVHAVVLLLGCLAAGPQLRAPEAVRALWALPMAAQSNLLKRHERTVEQGQIYGHKGTGLSFGQVLLWFVETATKPDQHEMLLALFETVRVLQSRPQGRIYYPDRVEYFIDPNEPPFSRYRAPMETMTFATPAVFLELAEVVMQSRREAARLGIPIPWQEAWRALGFDPPPHMFPQHPLVPISESVSSITGPETTEAAEAPPSAASETGLPAARETEQPFDKAQGSLSHPERATPELQADRSPSDEGDRHDAEQRPGGADGAAA
jgi:hypothetical protein